MPATLAQFLPPVGSKAIGLRRIDEWIAVPSVGQVADLRPGLGYLAPDFPFGQYGRSEVS
ncbi:hypothetical protein MTX78_14980 [Hymenobacter tibetensis]|uniref:Uncharacterized protein n=1 Tax=Hymenobacter tibetensis TaxID=497967 RepID=A0ABY4CTQ4_9BACT|nr:hypothetical protein [Hymenobacter tibetensis]UOG73427.1 hypothetical protein MTX78_14980 [Hymenobacter tibetensis]